jgi:tetratricopeptide (TPR) repeat protein
MLRRFVRLVCTWAVVLLSVVSADAQAQSSAKPDEKAARDAFERGRVYYDGGEFDQAASAFEEAYRLSGRDALLYNLYLAYRDSNQQQQAADALRGYLAKVPSIDNRSQLEARLHALDQGLERERQQQQAVAAVPAPVAAPVAAPVPAVQPAQPEPLHDGHGKRFWAGIALAGAGGALMLTSIATGVLAKQKQSDLEARCVDRICDDSLRSTADSGKTLAHATDALLFGGLAVAAVGTVLVVLDWRGAREHKPLAFDGACSRTGCTAHAAVRF